MTISKTSFDLLLKRFYSPEKLKSSLDGEFALLDALEKREKCGGSKFVSPLLNGNAVRISTDYTTAYNGLDVTPGTAFEIPYVERHGLVTIDQNVMRQSDNAGNVGAFVSAWSASSDQVMSGLRRATALAVYRDGTGMLSTIGASTNVATSVITLANPGDSFNFIEGQALVFAATAAGAIRVGTTSLTVTQVDPSGLVYLSGVLNSSVTLAATGDFIGPSGGVQNGASDLPDIAGLQAWAPATTAALGSLFGVARTSRRKTAGGYTANSGSTDADEQLQKGVTALIANSAKAANLEIFVNPLDYLSLSLIQGSKVLMSPGGSGTMGFRDLSLATAGGAIKIKSDAACPQKLGFIVDTSEVFIASVGQLISIDKEGDSSALTKVAGSAAYYAGWTVGPLNLVAARPGLNIQTVAFA